MAPAMTTTTEADAPGVIGTSATRPRRRPAGNADEHPPRLAAPARRRRPYLLVASVVVVIGCAAFISSAFAHASAHAEIVVATRDVAAGAVITSADITAAQLSGSGSVSAIPSAQESMIVGRQAKLTIAKGEVVPRSAVGQAIRLTAGNEAVGVALNLDELPADGVAPGESVVVIEVAAPGSPATPAIGSPGSPGSPGGASANPFASQESFQPGSVVVASSTVLAAYRPPASTGSSYAEVVTIEVPDIAAPDVVALAAAHEIGLALQPGDPSTATAAGSNP